MKVQEHITAADKTSFLKCLEGWKLTLTAILQFWEKLYHDGRFISFNKTAEPRP